MHLISTLASGVKGAENGTAEIYVRGVATRATYYSDFEAGTAIATGADVVLDSNGGAEVYVNQYVDVVVKDSDGVTVREFTEGKAAPNVEYIGQSFTGVDYVTGASAASKPVNAQTIFDRWLTSAGSVDFNVLLEGAATTIQAALGTVSGYFYNVKSSAYGAEGDGTTNDTTAITTAIAAAAVNGGTVFFPAGTYLVTSSIALPANVSLLGLGSDISIITMDHASNDLLTLSGASSGGFQNVKGIGFTAAQSYSGRLLYGVTEETFIKFEYCSFGGSYTTSDIVNLDIDHAIIAFESCYFCPGEIAAGEAAVEVDSSGAAPDVAWYVFNNCDFKAAAGQTATGVYLLKAGQAFIHGCRFDCMSMTNAVTITCAYLYGTASTDIPATSAIGNLFIGSDTATVYAMDALAANLHSYEAGNACSDNISAMYGVTSLANQSTAFIRWSTREGREYDYGTDNSAALTFPAREYGVISITRSDATALALAASIAPIGSTLSILIRNSNGGAPTGNITFDSDDFYEATGPITVAASSFRVATFKMVTHPTAGNGWALVGVTADI